MRDTVAIILVALALAGVVLGQSEKEAQNEEQATASSWVEKTASSNGVELSAKVMRCQDAGHPILVVVNLSGSKGIPVNSFYGLPCDFLRFTIVDEDNDVVPLTRYGKAYFASQLAEVNREVIWTPVAEEPCKLEFDISRLFDLTLPGKYRIAVTKDMQPVTGDQFTIVLEALEFEVTEPEVPFEDRVLRYDLIRAYKYIERKHQPASEQ
jgi:hypothetical protein